MPSVLVRSTPQILFNLACKSNGGAVFDSAGPLTLRMAAGRPSHEMDLVAYVDAATFRFTISSW